MQINTTYRMISFKEFCETLALAGHHPQVINSAQNLTQKDSFDDTDALYRCEFLNDVVVEYLQTRYWIIHCKGYDVTGIGLSLQEADSDINASIAAIRQMAKAEGYIVKTF